MSCAEETEPFAKAEETGSNVKKPADNLQPEVESLGVVSGVVYYKDLYGGKDEPAVDSETRFLDPKDLVEAEPETDSSSSVWSSLEDPSSQEPSTVDATSEKSQSDDSLVVKGHAVTIVCHQQPIPTPESENTRSTVTDETNESKTLGEMIASTCAAEKLIQDGNFN